MYTTYTTVARLLYLLTLALLVPARRPGRHAPGAIRPTRPRRTRRVRPFLPEAPPPPELYARHHLVGPWLVAHERQQEQEREDATRRGLDALTRLARPADTPPVDDMSDLADAVHAYLATTGAPVAMWHCPAPRCEMAAPYPTPHQCPLIDPARAQQGPLVGVAR
ncbi:hypothetical protein F4561_006544 [Lipingzhangella halophila]|uniref:Uncharacterized protein n=1 Tax=Lipingzhangella halophila TaxID=1783352 RepID=A0A7W7RP77_9ACTN|nr:hypothetical protein [Lipingzhangella halophila]MBB4935635.1 hypothetical protein [Lipingzhangella halophila]